MKLFALVVFAMLITSGVVTAAESITPRVITAEPHVDPKPVIVIKNNLGGVIGDFLFLKQFIEKYDTKIQFDGPCISACTMLLRLPQDRICVTPKASFWFHRATHPDKSAAEGATKALFDYYPEWVRDFITKKGGLTEKFIIMKYDDVKLHITTC